MKISEQSLAKREEYKLQMNDFYNSPNINFKRSLTVDEVIEILENFKKDASGDRILVANTIVEHDDETGEDFTTLVLNSFVDEGDNAFRTITAFYAVDPEDDQENCEECTGDSCPIPGIEITEEDK